MWRRVRVTRPIVNRQVVSRPAVRAVAAGVALWWLAVAPCAAAPVTLDALDSGWYLANGLHLADNENYLTGISRASARSGEHRSFFLFDLSSVGGIIRSATLRLYNPTDQDILFEPPSDPLPGGYESPDPTETLHIYDVHTPVAAMTGGTAGPAGFDDLGSGTLYGSRVVSGADDGTVVEIPLNAAALAALNASRGRFLFGGALGTLADLEDVPEFVFGFSMVSVEGDTTRQLVLDVPEPSTFVLSCAAAVALAVRSRFGRRRRQNPATPAAGPRVC